jgi:hypothetical protein
MHRGTNSPVAPPHIPITPPIGEREGLQRLFEAITRRGGRVWGTKLRELGELVASGELDVDAALAVIEHGKWEQPIGPTIVDYLWTMAGQIRAEGQRLADEQRRREEAAAAAELERLAAEEVVQELRENPEVRADRMGMLRSALGHVPVSQNGHNGQNGKEPTGG